VSLEAAGVLSVCVVSSAFIAQTKYQADMLGMRTPHAVIVPHPISSASVAEMQSKCEESFEGVLATIRSGPIALPADAGSQGCSS